MFSMCSSSCPWSCCCVAFKPGGLGVVEGVAWLIKVVVVHIGVCPHFLPL